MMINYSPCKAFPTCNGQRTWRSIENYLRNAFVEFSDDGQEHDQLNKGWNCAEVFRIIGEENNKKLTDDIS